MTRDRKSLLISLGRIFQSIPPFFFNWIEWFFIKNNIKKYPFIILVAPPRSGSTLTYQILSRGTNSMYLTNLWNLLYSVPIIGGKFSRYNRSDTKDFISNKGLVGGVYGEAEGLKFWEYWIGQGLEEKRKPIPIKRAKYIRKVFGRLFRGNKAMVTAYLGHCFSINSLRKIFPGAIFIYLKRDPLSNIYSIMRIYKEMQKSRESFNWISLKPLGWEKKVNDPIIDKILWQYQSIIDRVESNISENDTLIVNYEDICNDPKGFLNQVRIFASSHNINLDLNLDNVPDSFIERRIDPELDADSMKIFNLLHNE